MTEANNQIPQSSQGVAPNADTSPPADSNAASKPTQIDRPGWLFDDSLFDPEKGIKVEDLGVKAKELFDFRKATDDAAAARKADTPEAVDGYGLEFPEGFKPPEGVELNEKSPLWSALREQAFDAGMTKTQFRKAAAAFVAAQAEVNKQFSEGVAAAKAEMFKQLGDNGAARVESVGKWVDGMFGEQIGSQLKSAMFTPDIVKAFEKFQTALSAQGVTSFTATGRESGRADGKPEGWEKMSPVDRLTWTRLNENQQGARR